jgi:Ca2+-binding EF-hand superfamily protein
MSRERSPRLASPEGMAAFRERATSPKASERPPSKGIASEFVRPLANDKAAVTADEEEETFQVAMRQNAMEFEAADVDNSETLDFEEFCAFIREREEHPLGRHPPNELLARFEELDRNHNGRIEIHEYLMFSLRDALSRSVTRVLDLLQAWDDDGSGDISKKEFRQAIKALGFEARQKEVDAVFDEMDNDGSGKLDYREMNQKIREFAGLTSQNKCVLPSPLSAPIALWPLRPPRPAAAEGPAWPRCD